MSDDEHEFHERMCGDVDKMSTSCSVSAYVWLRGAATHLAGNICLFSYNSRYELSGFIVLYNHAILSKCRYVTDVWVCVCVCVYSWIGVCVCSRGCVYIWI
jgi:hypothetical protein